MDHAERVAVAQQFAEAAKRAFPRAVKKVVLFGSVARHEDRADSDVDVLVVWDGDRRTGLHEMVGIAYPFLLRSGAYVSVKVLTPNDVEQADRSPFVEAVLAEGRVLA